MALFFICYLIITNIALAAFVLLLRTTMSIAQTRTRF